MDAEFLKKLEQVVGAAFVRADAATRRAYARTTSPDGTEPAAILRPENKEQIRAILLLAAGSGMAVYPISTGKNWGYGDACAPRSDCLLMDLSRMNRIVEVNSELAYAVVEPGVTQGQLAEYLERQRLPLVMDCTGAGPDTSLLGNTLERGFGHSAYGDHFAHSCAYEAVLMDGSLITTGFGEYPDSQAQHIYKWGVGPSLDGLLTQSNFGVVTRMTIWLMPKPECMNYYFIVLSQPSAMAELAERLRPLYLGGSLRNVLHCANDYRLLSSNSQFPWEEADGKTTLGVGAPAVYQRLLKQYHLSAWSCAGVLMGSRAEVRAARSHLRRALKGMPGVSKFFVLGDSLYDWSQKLTRVLPKWSFFNPLIADLTKIRSMVELLRGRSSYQFLRGAHWRARKCPEGNFNPLDSGAGLSWLGPVLPMTGRAVHEVNEIGDTIFRQFGFEYQVTFSFANERALCAIMSISFDHENPEERDRARQCETHLFDALVSHGYVPYRGTPSVQRALYQASPSYWRQIQKLQRAWDPMGLLAPGRYNPS
jgi:4-cresol dehydrogenase (hydroxylating) flavoprotein subunit